MRLVKFKAEHLQKIRLQDAQKDFAIQFENPAYGMALEQTTHSYTGIHDGEIIFCAGAQEVWENRALVWALLSESAPKHLRQIHKYTSAFLAQAKWKRMETTVENSFKQGHRWAKLLGFEPEGLMRSYAADGTDYMLYARVK